MKTKQKIIAKTATLELYDLSKYAFMNLSLVDMEGEEWRDIPQLNGHYLISNYSRIKSLPRLIQFISRGRTVSRYTKERIISQQLRGTHNEYTKQYYFSLQVLLSYEGQAYRFLVHRLMYELYVGSLDFETDELRIIHKDGDNLNNVVENLESSNGTTIFYKSLNNNTRPSKPTKPDKIYNQIGVFQFNLAGNLIQHFPSVTEAAKAFNTKVVTLKPVLSKRQKQYKGFVFRYETDTYDGEYADYSKSKQVSQYTVEGVLIKTYETLKQAFLETGTSQSEISLSALYKKKYANGFVWRYEGDNYAGDFIRKSQKEIVHQYDKKGDFLGEFESISEAAKSVNLTTASIFACVSGAVKTSGGYVWRYKDQPYHGEHKELVKGRAVTQLDTEGNILATFKTILDACIATGVAETSLRRSYHGTRPTAGGYVWRPSTEAEISKILTKAPSNTIKIRSDAIAVCQYTKEGEKIATFCSIVEAAKSTGVGKDTIRRFTKNPKHVNGKYIWRKEGDIYQGELKDTFLKSESRTITQYDLEGNKIAVFPSGYAARKALGVSSSHSSIFSVLNGESKSANGFIWRFGDGPDKIPIAEKINARRKAVSCYDLSGNKKGYYQSLVEAARETNISYISISYAANRKVKTASKHVWIYGDGIDKIDV
ncbi:MAG: NUMOD1 domain-containing DNA-binding protein, partial [Arcicella sp.]|nr:NUMOD1 domain-containing DNA-binding protein [Arcicella sp.]